MGSCGTTGVAWWERLPGPLCPPLRDGSRVSVSILVGRSLAISVLGIYALSPIVGLTFLARAAMIAGFAECVATLVETRFDVWLWSENCTEIHTCLAKNTRRVLSEWRSSHVFQAWVQAEVQPSRPEPLPPLPLSGTELSLALLTSTRLPTRSPSLVPAARRFLIKV